MDFRISEWISGFHSGFLDFSLDFCRRCTRFLSSRTPRVPLSAACSWAFAVVRMRKEPVQINLWTSDVTTWSWVNLATSPGGHSRRGVIHASDTGFVQFRSWAFRVFKHTHINIPWMNWKNHFYEIMYACCGDCELWTHYFWLLFLFPPSYVRLCNHIYKDLKNIKNVKRCRDGMPKSMQTR